jgi:hypothetical protein
MSQEGVCMVPLDVDGKGSCSLDLIQIMCLSRYGMQVAPPPRFMS